MKKNEELPRHSLDSPQSISSILINFFFEEEKHS